MDDGAALAFRVAEQASPALYELARVGGTGEQEAHAEVGEVDAFIETTDGDHGIEKSAAQVAEDFLSLLGAFLVGEIADAESVFLPQQPGHRADLSDVLLGDRIGGSPIAAVEDRLTGFLGQGFQDLVEHGEFVFRAGQQPGDRKSVV